MINRTNVCGKGEIKQGNIGSAVFSSNSPLHSLVPDLGLQPHPFDDLRQVGLTTSPVRGQLALRGSANDNTVIKDDPVVDPMCEISTDNTLVISHIYLCSAYCTQNKNL